MTYEHKSNVGLNRSNLLIKIIGAVLIIIIFLYIIFPNFTSNIFTLIASPFWSLEQKIEVGSNTIPTELQDATIEELTRENNELKNVLHNASTSSPYYLSYIIKKPPFTAYDSYIINISNSKKVINVGDKVYAPGNVLLGEIVEKNSSFAKVKLYSSFGEKFDVVIGKKNIQAVAIGRGGGSFEVILPKDSGVSEGDSVIIPDLEVSIFGVVKRVTVDNARAFSTIIFSQPINIYEQKWVLVKSKESL